MTLRFEEILHILKASTKGNIGGRERLMKLKKGVVKAQIDRAKKKKCWRNTLATLTTFLL